MKNIALLLLIFGMGFPTVLLAQMEPNDIALASDEFQDFFYESLLQKGIENYDKAINALEKCENIQPNNAVVYFEMGKNYLASKQYVNAYSFFEKATQINPKNMWFWVGMYDVCYETKDYPQAIVIVTKLVEFKKEYKEDLVSLYMNTQQFEKALLLINELNETVGKSDLRDNYKAQILRESKYQTLEKEDLIVQIKKFPKEESNYISLIYLYSESNQDEKASEVAKKLEEEIPTSAWAQVSLFKFHLNNNDGENAVKSMNLVLSSQKIDEKIKQRMFNEFLIFSKDKPQFDSDIEHAISFFDTNSDVQVPKEIAKFYHNKKDWNRALKYYKIHLRSKPNDIEAILLLFGVYIEKQQFDELAKDAESNTELFPLQPQFYYFAGLANNQLKNHKKAASFLEMGLDYLVEDKTLEINFYIQLGEAYNGLGNQSKKDNYFIKADKLINSKK